jgi:hypothetical protein
MEEVLFAPTVQVHSGQQLESSGTLSSFVLMLAVILCEEGHSYMIQSVSVDWLKEYKKKGFFASWSRANSGGNSV